MDVPLADGLTIHGYTDQNQALDASLGAAVLRRLTYDGVSVTPCFLRVVEDGEEHYFAAYHLQQYGAAGEKVGESLVLALNKDGKITPESIWIPPQLLDGEAFSIAHFARGIIESTEEQVEF